jgi:DNA-binding transcriptional MerR regulator
MHVPEPKNVLNAFTAAEIEDMIGLSVEMIDYLAREGYLVPTYGRGRVRGRVRYYSYRDLVIANVVQSLRKTGVELARLKKALRALKKDAAWFESASPGRKSKTVQWLVTDGRKVLLKHEDGFLDELRPGGQRSFAFVVNMNNIQREVREQLSQEKLKHYTIENRALVFGPKIPKSGVRRGGLK